MYSWQKWEHAGTIRKWNYGCCYSKAVEKNKMKGKLINRMQQKLIQYARGGAYDIVMCNYYFGSYEMDVFKLNDKMWITEYEIKISRTDFKKDFTKTRTRSLYDDKFNYQGSITTNKHEQLEKGECKPNRFYFVVPEGLVAKEEIPPHAGLLYYDEKTDSITVEKNARLLHKNPQPVTIYKDIARGLSFREIRYRQEKLYYSFEIKDLLQRIKYLEGQLKPEL
jgi:hypothetical protein